MPKKIKNKTNPGQPPKDGDLIREEYANGGWVEKQYHEPATHAGLLEIEIASDKSIIAAVGKDTATLTITLLLDKMPTNSMDGITYYLPVFKADGAQYGPLISIVFSGGISTFEFEASESSFYSFDLENLRPSIEAATTASLDITAV